MNRSLEGAHGDAVAYALGALDAAARDRFEAHAAICADCLREVEELRPVVDALALAVPQLDPPPALEARLMAQAQALAPVAADVASRSDLAPVPFPLRRPQRPWWQRLERVSGLVAAAALVVAVSSVGMAVTAHQQTLHAAQTSNQTAAQLADTLAFMYQPGNVWRTLDGTEVTPQAKGRVCLNPEGGEAYVMTYNLPRLSPNEVYQLWVNNPESNKRVSGGVFDVDAKGNAHVAVRVPGSFAEFRGMGVTKEPSRQGSAWPTGPRVLNGSL